MKKIILDTDMGSDCDDAGALAVLHRMADLGKADILAVTHCASEISGAVAVKAINEWYGRGDIPVGRYDTGVFLEEEICRKYTGPIMEEYLVNHPIPKFENGVRLLRKTLANNTCVTIVVIGMLNNICGLLGSESDDITPLSGKELIKQNVESMYVMGGNFKDFTHGEYNIKCDVAGARYVTENFPVPIVYCGFELGVDIITGKKLYSVPESHPVRKAYTLWGDTDEMQRSSWDPITVYCAVEQENHIFKPSEAVSITFDDNACAVVTYGGKDRYMIAQCENDIIRDTLDEIMY